MNRDFLRPWSLVGRKKEMDERDTRRGGITMTTTGPRMVQVGATGAQVVGAMMALGPLYRKLGT